MASENDQLLDQSVAHQVRLLRTGEQASRDTLAQLNSDDEALLATVAAILSEIDNATPQQIETARDVIEAEIAQVSNRSVEAAAVTLVAALTTVVDAEEEFQRAMLEGVTGQQIERLSDELKEAALASTVEGASVSRHIGRLAEKRVQRIVDEIAGGVIAGRTVDETLSILRGTPGSDFTDGELEFARRSFDAISKTFTTAVAGETGGLVNSGTDVVWGEYWAAILDSRTTPICRAMSGATRVKGAKVWSNGKNPGYPAHWGERSTIVPLTGVGSPSDVTYQDWLARQPESVQEEILGQTRLRLYKEGRLRDLDSYVDDRGQTLTLDELRERDRESFREAGLA